MSPPYSSDSRTQTARSDMTGDAENRNENDSSASDGGLRAESRGKMRAGQREAPRQRDDAVVNPRRALPRSSRLAMASVMNAAIWRISSSPKPRLVTAGVPRRMPLVRTGGSGSKGMAFLLAWMWTVSSAASASRPLTPSGRTSTSIRWLSVPPETRRRPLLLQRGGQRLGVVEDALLVERGTPAPAPP